MDCVSALAWPYEDRASAYKILTHNNIYKLELAPAKIHPQGLEASQKDLLSARAEWESHGLKAVSLQSLHFGAENLALFNSEEERTNLAKITEKAMQTAHLLEIPWLVFGSPKLRVIPSEMSSLQSHQIALDFFYQLGEKAKNLGCTLGLEANAKAYGTNFLTTTAETLAFIKELKHPHVSINVDLSTLILENEDIASVLNDLPHTKFHAHLSIPYLKDDFSSHSANVSLYQTYLKDKVSSLSLEMLSSKGISNLKNILQKY